MKNSHNNFQKFYEKLNNPIIQLPRDTSKEQTFGKTNLNLA